MTALQDLQRDFIAYLREQPNGFLPRVSDGRRAAAPALLGIYRHAYAARLEESLGNDFPKLRSLLGAERFGRLVRDYLRACPSRTNSVRWVGDRLAEFLRRSPIWSGEPILADMADFEWALAGAFDAADAAPAGADDFALVPGPAWPSLRFDLHPSARIVMLSTDAPSVWLAIDRGDPPRPAPPETGTWLVWRIDLEVKFRRLETDEAGALARLESGADFAILCEALAEAAGPDKAAYRAAELLRGWIDSGLIAGIRADAPLST
jgi:hypothetical protein